MGVTLLGHFLGADGNDALFAPDLHASIAWGDQRHQKIVGDFRDTPPRRASPGRTSTRPQPIDADPLERIPLERARRGAVHLRVPARLRLMGRLPRRLRRSRLPRRTGTARAPAVPGLYFAGVHFLRKRKSSLLIGVGEDAAIVARQIAER